MIGGCGGGGLFSSGSGESGSLFALVARCLVASAVRLSLLGEVSSSFWIRWIFISDWNFILVCPLVELFQLVEVASWSYRLAAAEICGWHWRWVMR